MFKNVYSIHGRMPNGTDVVVGGMFYKTKQLAKREAKNWIKKTGGECKVNLVTKKTLDEMCAMGMKFMVALER